MISHPPVLKLEEHCSALSSLLHDLAYQEPASVVKDGETYGWAQPADWLDLAASITKVDVLTAQGDSTLEYCESALDYENDQSALLSQFVTSLTVFSFVWALLNPLPRSCRPRRFRRRSGSTRLLTDLHQIITRLGVVLVWLGVAPCRV